MVLGGDVGADNCFDEARYRASMERLEDIYRSISESAVAVSAWRCPYKDVQDYCTARIGCRNQSFVDGPDKLALCTGSDALNYRDAWEEEA